MDEAPTSGGRSGAAKKVKLVNSSPKDSGNTTNDAILLTSLPYDILCEIFAELDPGDLVSLSKTNSLLRDVLLSDGLTSLWKQGRENRRGPDCPADMAEPEWAAFLFVHQCQKCGAKDVRKADFLIRRRLCVPCRKQHVISVSDVQPEIPKYILDLLPFTTAAKVDYYLRVDPQRKSPKQFLYKPDIYPILHKIAQYEQLASTSPASKKMLEQFKATKIHRIRKMHETGWACHNWLHGAYLLQRDQERVHIPDRRRKAIFERFFKLGYNQDNVSVIKNHIECGRYQELTDAVWKRIRPILEPEVKHHADMELARKLSITTDSRKKLVAELYDVYESTIPSSEWRFLPEVHEVCEFAPFSEIINAPGGGMVTADDFQDAMGVFPGLLKASYEARLNHLRSMLPASRTSQEPTVDRLGLAILVFRCHQGPPFIHAKSYVLVGTDDLMSHHRDMHEGYSNPNLSGLSYREFSADGARIAHRLVQLAGLDAESALASDMDAKDLRFSCKCCELRPPLPGVSYPCNRAYTWRAAIGHCLPIYYGLLPVRPSNTRLLPTESSWSVIAGHQATLIKARELRDVKSKMSLWICGHCSAFAKKDGLQMREAVVTHLASMHAIFSPQIPSDFFMFSRSSPMHYTNASSIQYDVS